MSLKIANNAVSRLAASLSASSTNLGVLPGEGAKFPSLADGDWFPLVIIKSDGSLEIVRCTARSSDTFTITRAQEGTAALAFSAGDRVELRATKAAFEEINTNAREWTASVVTQAEAEAGTSTTARKWTAQRVRQAIVAGYNALTSSFGRTLANSANDAAAREALSLGSAALKNAQTSADDHTSGSLMQVGGFGIGAAYDFRGKAFHGNLPPENFFGRGTMFGLADGGSSASIESLKIPGLAGNTFGVLCVHGHHSDATAAGALQRWFLTRDRFFVSVAADASTWGPWRELYHTDNLQLPLGQGQTWQLVSRALNTTYYNTTGRSISVNVAAEQGSNGTTFIWATVSGVKFRISGDNSAAYPISVGNFIVPAGAAYLIESSTAIKEVHELR